MQFFSTTKPGKVANWLTAGFFACLLIAQMFVASGEQGGETIFDNLKISVPMLLAMLCAVASFFAGLFSIIFRRDRSVLVIISTLIGLLLILFIIGEVAFPH